MKPDSTGSVTEGEPMLSYLETLHRLTVIRDGLRAASGSEKTDHQWVTEQTAKTLSVLLREMITPDPADEITVYVLSLSHPPKATEPDPMPDDMNPAFMPPAYCINCEADLRFEETNGKYVSVRSGSLYCKNDGTKLHDPRR